MPDLLLYYNLRMAVEVKSDLAIQLIRGAQEQDFSALQLNPLGTEIISTKEIAKVSTQHRQQDRRSQRRLEHCIVARIQAMSLL
jgi:hypothetical protein